MDREFASVESTELPAELAGRTPRRVRITGTGWLNVFAALLFSSIGIALAAKIVKQLINNTAAQDTLQRDGSETQGQVSEKWTQSRSLAPYDIGYSFSVDGTFYTGKSAVPSDIWNGLHRYDSLPIRYLPANPSINHPSAWKDSPYSSFRGLIFPAFLALFGLMFVRKFPSQRRLAMEGIAIRGSITECWGPGRSGGFGLKYTFRNARSGETESGSCSYDSSRKVGSDVWLLYLSSDPRRSEVYPFGIPFYRIEQ